MRVMAQTPEERKAKQKAYNRKYKQKHAEQLKALRNTEQYKSYRRQYFQDHHARMISQSLANARKRQKWFQDYKRNMKCSMCGKSFPDYPGIIEFHHEGEGKESGDHLISRLITNKAPMARLQTEVAKCTPLCANCHRRVHDLERQKKKKGLVRPPVKETSILSKPS